MGIVNHCQLGRRNREAEVLGELDERIQRIPEAVGEGVVVDDLSGDVALDDPVERGAEVGGIVGSAERLCAGDDVLDLDRKSTRLNSSHLNESRMPSSA